MQELVIGGMYRHFKGDFYKVLGLAKHSETKEDVVIYVSLYPPHEKVGYNAIRVRPKEMFLSPVDTTKYPEVQQEYRFQLVRDEEYNEI